MGKITNVLVEGCDCSGKTTFIRDLKDAFYKKHKTVSYSEIHNGPYKSTEEAFRAYKKQLEEAKLPTFIDRAHISELVYGTIYRKRVPHRFLFQGIDAKFCESTLLVYCRPAFKYVLKEWSNRRNSEMIKDSEDIQAIYNLYDYAVFNITDMHYLQYDYKNDKRSFVENIIDMIDTGKKK